MLTAIFPETVVNLARAEYLQSMLVQLPVAELAVAEGTIHEDKHALPFRLLLAVDLASILGALLDFLVSHEGSLPAYLLVDSSTAHLLGKVTLLLSLLDAIG